MKFYDDVIPEQSQISLEELFLGPHFHWHLNKNTIDDENLRYGYPDLPQFIHKFIMGKEYLSPYVKYVLTELCWQDTLNKLSLQEEKYVMRMKANLIMPISSIVQHPPHTDLPEDVRHIVMLYYVNDSDGPTIIFEKDGESFTPVEKIDPKRGRFLVFDGSNYHASSTPTKNPRCVINFNLTNNE